MKLDKNALSNSHTNFSTSKYLQNGKMKITDSTKEEYEEAWTKQTNARH